MTDFLNKNFYRIFQAVILTIFLTPILAPIFAHFGLTPISRAIYLVYSYSCHQLAHRSLHIYDYQCAWCTRDTFIWGGILLATFLVSRLDIKQFRIYWLIPFTIPIALDGGIQTIATFFGLSGGVDFYTSTNFTRAITGGIFGLGMGMFLATMIRNAELTTENISLKLNNLKIMKLSVIGFSALMVLYLLFVQVWDATSKEYKPDNFLDWSDRTPYEDAWIRQSHGTCDPEVPKNIKSGEGPQSLMFTPADCF